MKEKIKNIINKKVLAYNFGIYRIAIYSIFLLIYIAHLTYIEYETMKVELSSILCVGLIILSIINIIGIKFKIFGTIQFIVNAMLFIVLYDKTSNIFFYEGHVGHNLFFLLFINIFLPLEKTLSVDSLLKGKETKYIKQGYYIGYFLLIGAFYFYAFLYKALDENYYDKYFLNFLVVKTESLISINNIFLESLSWSGLGIYNGYIILIYQFLMLPILLFFRNKKIKNYYLIFSIIIHISFVMFYNVLLLTIIVLCMYIPLFNTRTFIRMLKNLKDRRKKISIYYDDECGFCSKISGIFKIFNFKRNIKIIGLSKNKEIDKNVLTIPININGKYYYGFEGFKELFKNNKILYMFNYIFNIKYLEDKYKEFAKNRKSSCKIIKKEKEHDNFYIGFIFIYVLIVGIVYTEYFIKIYKDKNYYYNTEKNIYNIISTEVPIFPFKPNMFIFYNLEKNKYENYVIKKENGEYINELKDKKNDKTEWFFNFEEMKKIKLARIYSLKEKGKEVKNIKEKIKWIEKISGIKIGEKAEICKREYRIDYKKIKTKEDLIKSIEKKEIKFEKCYKIN